MRTKLKTLMSCLLMIGALTTAQAQLHFAVDANGPADAADVIASSSAEIIEKLSAKWRKANREIDREDQNMILKAAKAVVAYRYLAVPSTTDSTAINLYLAGNPVGLIILADGERSLGMAYVNEANGTECYPLDIRKGNDKTQDILLKAVREDKAHVICGIDKPYKLFKTVDGQEFTIDMGTGETASFDLGTLPGYVYTGTQEHRTGAVFGSILGGIATLGIIALVAIL